MSGKKSRHLLYLGLSVIMVVIAIPRISAGQGWSLETCFGLGWLTFAILVIAAQLHALIGLNEETEQRLRRIRHAKALVWQRKLQQRKRSGY
jgi:hypothetical protein